MEKSSTKHKKIVVGITLITIMLGISLGFGYFLGRYEQIEINKSLLKIIPDTNCGKTIRHTATIHAKIREKNHNQTSWTSFTSSYSPS